MKITLHHRAQLPYTDPTAAFRSKGIHVSGIIKSVGLAIKAKGCTYNSETANLDGLNLCGAVGFAWERLLAQGLRGHCQIPFYEISIPTRDRNGNPVTVHGTPDGFDHVERAVLEFKATWRNANEELRDDPSSYGWKWFTQIKCYCYGLGVTKAKLWVFYVNGDMGKSSRWPIVKLYELEFTKDELCDFWDKQIVPNIVAGQRHE